MALNRSERNNILIAPLNWGLGHATRCIPIIRALEENGFTPILASDGVALEILRKEFPMLKTLELPSYGIEYAKNMLFFKWKMLLSLPKINRAASEEKKITQRWVSEYNLCGIISDNRLGVSHPEIPSVYLTHQLNVLSGTTSWISGKLHRSIIKKFDECWVPDVNAEYSLSGKLSRLKNPGVPIQYIGPLSRMEQLDLPKKYDLMVLLSGPEPQRGILEERLREMLPDYNGKVVFICGKIESEQKETQTGNITFYNFMTTKQLGQTFCESEKVLCRSGYTTIMDLAKLQKKAFFIPTPGQYEQEYLAENSAQNGFAAYAKQDDFELIDLERIDAYSGFPDFESPVNRTDLFRLFERKRKF